MTQPKILETTLRDGSYVINFQFTAKDTAVIAAQLDKAGFGLIEVGHGVGMGASEAGHGTAAETDEEYMKAAAEACKSAKWGMFCIPGIARLEHIDMAAEHGMNFVRIGTNVSDVEDSAPFVERAKKRGMYVCANYMKSYAAEPAEFARKAELSQKFGVDCVYIVDSAGGMLPDDMAGYFKAVREATTLSIGFHGHDNLGLSVANAMRAVELGADIVDTSLQGMGRSAGNTPTELFIVVMERLNRPTGFDPLLVMDIGEKYIKPLLQKNGISSLDVVSGFAQFHSSYMGLIREFSGKFDVDPRKLIIALCNRDRVNAPRALVEELARTLSHELDDELVSRFRFERYHGAEQLPSPKRMG